MSAINARHQSPPIANDDSDIGCGGGASLDGWIGSVHSVLARHQQHRHQEEESSAVRRRRHVAAHDDDDRVLGACSRRGGGGVAGRPAGRGGQSDSGGRRGRGCVTAAARAPLFCSERPRRPPRTRVSFLHNFPSCTCVALAAAFYRRRATTTINKPVERATGLMLAESAPSAICSLFLLH